MRRRIFARALTPLLLTLLLLAEARSTPSVRASASLPPGFAESTVALFGPGSFPTDMEIAPDGRVFVALKYGDVRVIKDGALLPAPFTRLTTDGSNERGLIGLTLDPAFASNGYVYLHYTLPTTPARDRISRFTAAGDQAVPGSETVLLELDPQQTTFHKAGGLKFGIDGKLYIPTGNDNVDANSQSLDSRLGKVLRVNPDGSIPADNPFYSTATGLNRAIWALGLRNPFKIAVQPGSGTIIVNDVGLATREEINLGAAGSNYGWPLCEGSCSPPNPSFTDPLFEYSHGLTDTTGYSITGGAFYNPSSPTFPPEYRGKYFFADYVSGWIRSLDPASRVATSFLQGVPNLVDLEVGPDGALYYLTIAEGTLAEGRGAVRRIQYTGSQAPQIGQQPQSLSVAAGATASFEVRASGTAPLAYQWQRNGVDIPGATASVYTTPPVSTADSGARYRCLVSNAFGTAVSEEALLSVSGNQPPVATIDLPPAGTLYSGGETIGFSGSASDPEAGTLAASAFTWQVDFHHDTHVHPGFLPPTSGISSGSFVIADEGETSANVWYRVHLTVRDPEGAEATTYRDIFPRTASISLTTSPPGLGLTLDGTPHATPYTVTGVVGVKRVLGVVSPQTVGGITYEFVSWSDGGSATHTIATPPADTTYTAAFRPCSSACAASLAASYSSDPPRQWQPGQTASYSVTVTNTGFDTWNATGTNIVRLGVHFGTDSDIPHDGWQTDERFFLARDVAPGESIVVPVTVAAPQVAGEFVLRHRMVKEDVAWFDQVERTAVTVGEALAASYGASPPLTWASGETKTYSVTLTNTGFQTWNATGTNIVRLGVHFGDVSDVPHDGWLTDQRFFLPRDVAAGESVTLQVSVTAPSAAGSFVLRQRLVKEDVAWFDDILRTNVSVTDTQPPVISNVRATNITDSTAVITWSTSEPATSQVFYERNPAHTGASTLDGRLVTQHSVTLTGLQHNSGYSFQVSSRDAAGNLATSASFSFRTGH